MISVRHTVVLAAALALTIVSVTAVAQQQSLPGKQSAGAEMC